MYNVSFEFKNKPAGNHNRFRAEPATPVPAYVTPVTFQKILLKPSMPMNKYEKFSVLNRKRQLLICTYMDLSMEQW